MAIVMPTVPSMPTAARPTPKQAGELVRDKDGGRESKKQWNGDGFESDGEAS